MGCTCCSNHKIYVYGESIQHSWVLIAKFPDCISADRILQLTGGKILTDKQGERLKSIGNHTKVLRKNPIRFTDIEAIGDMCCSFCFGKFIRAKDREEHFFSCIPYENKCSIR
jgi:hypothetical protein